VCAGYADGQQARWIARVHPDGLVGNCGGLPLAARQDTAPSQESGRHCIGVVGDRVASPSDMLIGTNQYKLVLIRLERVPNLNVHEVERNPTLGRRYFERTCRDPRVEAQKSV
jgi:hypothetical protein